MRYLTVIVLLLVLSGLVFAKMKLDKKTGSLNPLETGEIIPNVYAIKDQKVNMYAAKVNGQFIAFDAGDHPRLVRRELQKLGIDPEKFTDVFLTHSHQDHSGALEVFSNAKIHISKEEADYLNDTLLCERTYNRPYWNRQVLEKVVSDHTHGRGTYLREIRKVLQVELVHRLMIEDIRQI